jgi:endonuclease-3
MNEARRVKRIFDILLKKYDRSELTELNYINPYTLLVAVILSAQTTDVGVNKATSELFKIVKTPEDMLNFGFDNLRQKISSINYYNTKAKHIIAMSEKLVKNFNSRVPATMADLISLDGVGRKTANIILNIVYDKPAIAVDTHVFRVSARLGLAKAKNAAETEKQLLRIVPKKYVKQLNNILVLFGRYDCKALRPRCDDCILEKYCPSKNLTPQKMLPQTAKR